MRRLPIAKWGEILWPWICASASATAGFLLYNRFSLLPEAKAKLLEKLVDFCSIGVGFWATALALLLALEGRDTVAGLKSLDIYRRVVTYFLHTVYSCFVLLGFCLFSIALGRVPWPPHRLLVALWSFLVTLTVTLMLRSFGLLGKLLRSK